LQNTLRSQPVKALGESDPANLSTYQPFNETQLRLALRQVVISNNLR
jgi:hypothetical protein